jgi:tetratricopeptide (TPR) repeat protein
VGGQRNETLVELDLLPSEDANALLDGLGGGILETDRRDRIVEAAEGNPFFLEQLLALELEGGLAGGAIPETIQALLAARLDRLGPGERAVLERGAVIGKEFRLDDVSALVEPEAAPTVATHLESLSARGFVRPEGADEFRFRHVLLQEAVYRAAPKRLRAELHERFIDRFEERRAETGDVDEFAGYHLEQAYRLRTELGESDRRVQSLAADAGQRLGAAGMRAFKRGDNPASRGLLVRATSLLSLDEPLRRELRCNLAIALFASGDTRGAAAVLEAVVAESEDAGDARLAAWAQIELEYMAVRRGEAGDALLDAVTAGIETFEREGDHRALGRAWLFAGWLKGGHRGDHAAWLHAAEHALKSYRGIGWPTSTCLGEIGCALYWGATPVSDAIARCEQLLREETTDLVGAAYVHTFLGGLTAQRGDLGYARKLVQSARDTLDDLGQRWSAQSYSITVLGEIELLAGDGSAAVAIFRGLCDELERRDDFSHLASRASDLAEALLLEGDLDEAEAWTTVAERHAAADDVNAQMMWRPIRARVLARRGDLGTAELLAREGVRIGDATDDLNRRAEARRDLGEVLRIAGRTSDAESALQAARSLFEQKGNVVGATHVQSLLEALGPAKKRRGSPTRASA